MKRYKQHNLPYLIFVAAMFLVVSAFSANASVLTSSRSMAVCQKVTPLLEKDLADQGLQFGNPIYIRIFKESNELELWIKDDYEFKLFKTYEICSLSGELGPKQKEGDRQSPEGFYYVTAGQLNPFSSFHLSFNIGYPNAYDRTHGRTGSALMVHGSCVSVGCFAMTDPKIEEIYTLAETALRNGQDFFRIHIFPFRMTAENMAKHKNSQWISFWQNLKEGYDSFEKTHIPPNTRVKKKKYIFETRYGRTADTRSAKRNPLN